MSCQQNVCSLYLMRLFLRIVGINLSGIELARRMTLDLKMRYRTIWNMGRSSRTWIPTLSPSVCIGRPEDTTKTTLVLWVVALRSLVFSYYRAIRYHVWRD